MNLIHSLFTVFFIVAIGYACGIKRIFNESQTEGFEIFLFKIAIPFYLFSSILAHDFSSLINIQYIFCYILCFLSVAAIVVLYFFGKNSISEICIKILVAGYVNAAIYTLPVITFLLNDPKAAIIGNLVQVIIIQSTFLCILSFLKHKESSMIKKLTTSLSSPMIVFPVVGMILSYLQFNLPESLVKPIQNIGSSASGMALFVFGLTISRIELKREYFNRDLLFLILAKNIIHPTFAILFGRFIFHLESYWFNALVIATSAPTAFIVYLIAKQFIREIHFVRIAVAITSIVSLLSIVLISDIIFPC